MTQQYDVTSVGVNPSEDRVHRMRMYLTAMIIRVACVVSLFWVQGWWVLVAALGAVILPYVAVMLGNAVANTSGAETQKPTPLALQPGEQQAPETLDETQMKFTQGSTAASQHTIIIDAPIMKSGSTNESGSTTTTSASNTGDAA